MVRVNCEAVVRVSRLFIPRMVERRRGWMLVVASTASFQPIPYNAVYAATKAFDRFFSLALAAEVERFGIKITALCPGPTETEFFDVSGRWRRVSAFRWSSVAQLMSRTGRSSRSPGASAPSFPTSRVHSPLSCPLHPHHAHHRAARKNAPPERVTSMWAATKLFSASCRADL